MSKSKNQKAPAKGRTLKDTLKTYAKSCAAAILRFLRMRRKFTDSLVFGVVVALLLNLVPWIGGLLAGAVLFTSICVGITLELQDALTKLFNTEVPDKDSHTTTENKKRKHK